MSKNPCFLFNFNDTHRKKTVLLNSVQEFIEIEAWLLLIFFMYLHNQLNSIHSIVTYYRVRMFAIKLTKIERLLLSASFTSKFELVFVNTGTRFVLEVSF